MLPCMVPEVGPLLNFHSHLYSVPVTEGGKREGGRSEREGVMAAVKAVEHSW